MKVGPVRRPGRDHSPIPVPMSGPAFSRRQLLTGAAAGGLGLAVSPLLGRSAGATTAVPRAAVARGAAGLTGTINDVDHVVFLMMENRSFDHLFGTMSGVRGFDDRSVCTPGGGNIFAQPDVKSARGSELPFLLSLANDGQNTPSLSHNWGPQHRALNGGGNDGWIAAHRAADGAKGPLTMGYYGRSEVPYHYALADAFTVLDGYHCSVLGPTYPNRFLWQVGSIDTGGAGGGPLLTTDENIFTKAATGGGFSFETYPERLSRAGVEWRAYTDEASNHLFNMLPAFKQYQDPRSDLYQRGVRTSSPQFLADAEAGNLPAVSWIFPSPNSSEHPDDGAPNAGPTYYAPVVEALMRSPKWSRTVLFITWDENDGYFDHVPPPVAPPGTKGEYLTHAAFGASATADPSERISGPVGLGFRVPTIVVSPFARGGFVNSETADHMSGLLFLEKRFGVEVSNISAWRRSVVGDFTSTMDFRAPDLSMPNLATAFAASQAMQAPTGTDPSVPATQVMPTQEKGTRPRRGPVPSHASCRSGGALAPAAAQGAAGGTTAAKHRGGATAPAKHPAAKHQPASRGPRESVSALRRRVSQPSRTLAFTGGLPVAGVAVGAVAAAGVAAVAQRAGATGEPTDGAVAAGRPGPGTDAAGAR